MNSEDSFYAVPVLEETALSSADIAKQTTATVETQLQSPSAEDDDEWEGFYEDGNYEEF